MALGIGANTAIFSVVNGVLLRPLPYHDGDQLVVLHHGQRRRARQRHGLLGEGHRRLPPQAGRSATSSSSTRCPSTCSGARSPSGSRPAWCRPNYFDVLGVQPLLRPHLRRRPTTRRARRRCWCSATSYWERSFGGDPSIVGRVFRMNDKPHTVVGVLPPVPQYPLDVDVYMPSSACPFRSAPQTVDERARRACSPRSRASGRR